VPVGAALLTDLDLLRDVFVIANFDLERALGASA
jgi:hypothetical protein